MCSNSTNCKVICDTERGCNNAIINASYAETLNLICSAYNSCKWLSIVSGARNYTEIACSGYLSCYESNFIVDNSLNVYLNCHVSACQWVSLQGLATNGNVKCAGNSACTFMSIIIDYKSNLNINDGNVSNASLIGYGISIICKSYSVYDNGPVQPIDASLYNTKWYCSKNGWYIIYQGALYCNSTELECIINCDIRDCSRYLIDGSHASTSFTVNCVSEYVCSDAVIVCPANALCVVNCLNTSSCPNTIIDGNNSHSLELHCKEYGCRYLNVYATNVELLDVYCSGESSFAAGVVYCPYTLLGSCNIYCQGEKGCYSMTTYGAQSNIISIHCQDKESCDYMSIHADNASHLEFNSSNYGANGVNIYAKNAGTIKMRCLEEYACHNIDINAVYAHSITIMAGYAFGFSSSNLYTNNVSALSISCSSHFGQYGCYLNNYYLPDYGENTRIYCYGTGCDQFGDIYVDSSVSSLRLFVNQCNECQSCINKYIIHCDYYNETNYYFSQDLLNGTQCVNGSQCGCSEMVSNAIFENDHRDKTCILSSYKTASKLILRYDLLYCLFLLFVPLILILVRWRIKYLKAYVVDKALVLMVGITTFDDEKQNLLNDEVNIKKLAKLWKEIYKYDVYICNEHSLYATKQNVIEFIDKHKVKLQEKLYKAVIVHIITHGFINGDFLTSDMKKVPTEFIEHELVSELEFYGNTSMIKLMFYHACRGSANYYKAIEVEETSTRDTSCGCNCFRNSDKSRPLISHKNIAVELNNVVDTAIKHSNRSGTSDNLDNDMSAHSNFVIIYQTIKYRVTLTSGHFTNCIYDVFVKNAEKWIKTNFIGMIREIGTNLERITSNAEICTTAGLGTLRYDPVRFETAK
eukprot:34526_1